MARVTLNAIIDADTKKFDAAIKGAQAGLLTLGKATALGDLAIGAAGATTQLLSMGNQIVQAGQALGALSFAGILLGAQAFSVLKLAMNENNAGAKTLKDTWQQMNNDFVKASASVLPGLNAGLKSASALVPVLSRGLSDTGIVLGRLAAEAGKVIASPLFKRDIGQIMAYNSDSMFRFGEAGITLLGPLRDLAAVAAKVLNQFSGFAPMWAQQFADFIAAKRASGELEETFRKGTKALIDFVAGVWAFGGVIKNVMEAAGIASGDTMGKLSNWLRELKKNTDEGTPGFEKMVEVFGEVNRMGRRLMEVFKGIGEDLKGVDLKALADAFIKITEATVELTPALVAITNAFADLVAATPEPVLKAIIASLILLKIALGIAHLIQAIAGAWDTLSTVLGPVVRLIGRLIAAFIRLGPVSAILHGIRIAFMAMVGVIAGAVGAITGTVLLIIAVVLAVIAAIVLLVIYWEQVWNQIKNIAGTIWRWMQMVWDEVMKAILWAWNNLGLKELWEGTWNTIKIIASTIWNILQVAWDTFLNVMKIAWETFSGIVTTLWEGFWGAIKTVAQGIWDAMQAAWDIFLGVIKGAWDVIAGFFTADWARVWEGLKEIGSSIWNGIQELWDIFLGVLMNLWNIFRNTLSEAWNIFWGGLKEIASTIWQGIREAWNILWQGIQAAWDSFINTFQEAWNTAWGTVKQIAVDIWESVKAAWQDFCGFFINVWNGFVGALYDAWNASWTLIKDTASAIWNALQIAWDAFLQFFYNIFDGWRSTLQDAWRNSWEFIKQIATDIWQALQVAWDAFCNFFIGIWNTVSGALQSAWNTVWNAMSAAAQAVWSFLQAAWDNFIIGLRTIWDTVSGALRTAWSAFWGAIQSAAQAVWNALVSAWNAFTSAMRAVYNAWSSGLQAAWTAFWNAIRTIAQAVWNALVSAWNAFTSAMRAVYNAWSSGLQAAWTAFWNTIRTIAQTVWGALQAAWNTFTSVMRNIYNAWSSGLQAAWSTLWNTIRTVATGIWDAIRTTFNNFLAGMRGVLEGFVSAVRTVWEGLREIFAAPIRFVVNTVYNDGIRRVANAVLDFVGLPTLPNVTVSFAKGGIHNSDRLPNDAMIQPGRGRGLVQWAESETGGEAFIPLGAGKRNRSVMLLGKVADMFGYSIMATGKNMAGPSCLPGACGGSCGPCKTKAANGLIRIAEDGFLGSGIGPDVGPDILPNVPSPSDILGGAADALNVLEDLASGIPIIGPALDAVLGFLQEGICAGVRTMMEFVGDIASDIAGMAGGRWAEAAVAIPRKLADSLIDYVCEQEATMAAAGGGGVGITQPVQAWAPIALQALALAGRPASELGCLLSRMQKESGGNSGAINLTDSNAAAGVPSQGLMQVIPPTFAAYCAPLCARGLTDPLANIYAATKYAAARYGGWCAADAQPGGYAQGGFHGADEPGAMIAGAGNGPLVRWAEAATGGEAYIPLGPGKRPTSMRILADVAKRFGMSLKPKAHVNMADGGIISFNDGGTRGWGHWDSQRGDHWHNNHQKQGWGGGSRGGSSGGGSGTGWIPPTPIFKATLEDMLKKMTDSGAAGSVDSMIRAFNRNNTVGQKIDPVAAAAERMKKNREIGFGGDLAALGRKGVSAELIEQIRGMGESGYELAATLATAKPDKLAQFIKAAGGGVVGGMYVPDAGSPPSINDPAAAAAAAALGSETGGSGTTVTHIHIHGSLVTEKEMYEKAYRYGVHRDKRTGKFGR